MKPLSQKLNDAIMAEARRLESLIGFGYTPDPMAPNTYEELRNRFGRSSVTKLPLPVFSGGSERTIYADREVNYAFRYCHDVSHIAGKWDFTLLGEIRTAYNQLTNLEVFHGYGPETLEWKLLYADTVGQTREYHRTGGFVEDQVKFVCEFVLDTFGVAVVF